MTTIAWDGRHLAADTRVLQQGNIMATTKLWDVWLKDHPNMPIAGPRALLGVAGNLATGLELKRWFLGGADPEALRRIPEAEFARLIVIDDQGIRVRAYESTPDAIQCQDRQRAWGSGVDFALAAMHLGLSAWQAVDLAHHFDPNTGPAAQQLTFD